MYHVRATVGTMLRILRQLSHDHRTVAMIFLVPIILLSILRWMFNENLMVFNSLAPALLGVFPFVIMFIITSVTTLRERTGGTMERLMAMPIGRLDLVLGYMLAFGLLAIVQAALASSVLLWGLGLEIEGPAWFLVTMAVSNALLGTALGIFVSAFARTEFQAIQFMPALILPQFLLCGLILPLERMPDALEITAYFLPLTYAVHALQTVVSETSITIEAWRDFVVVLSFAAASIVLGALTLRRRTK